MQQIIEAVIAKTGIDADKAKDAVETVLSFLREKLPEPMASKLDDFIGGGGEDGEGGGGVDVGSVLGGLFK